MELEDIWRIREEDIYPRLFDGDGRGIFVLTQQLFSERFRQSQIDPRWLFYGVFEYGPTSTRPFWLYVTSGHSNPWEDEPSAYDPAGPSGSGVEFIFATTKQGDWAIRFLQNMLAFDILLSAGRFAGGKPLSAGDRVPLRSPINGVETCELRNAIVSEADTLPSGFSLPSGQVKFLTFTGTGDKEIEFAKQNGTPELINALMQAGGYPVTDPARRSIF